MPLCKYLRNFPMFLCVFLLSPSQLFAYPCPYMACGSSKLISIQHKYHDSSPGLFFFFFNPSHVDLFIVAIYLPTMSHSYPRVLSVNGCPPISSSVSPSFLLQRAQLSSLFSACNSCSSFFTPETM